MLNPAKYVIIDGCAIVFSAAISHKDIAGNRKVTGAGFVLFKTEYNPHSPWDGESVIKAIAYGRSTSLGIELQEEDSVILTTQLIDDF